MGPIQFLEIKLLIPKSTLTTDTNSKFEPLKEPQVSGRSHKTLGPEEEPPEVRFRAVALSPLMLRPFNTAPHAGVTATRRVIPLLLHHCSFAIVANRNVNMRHVTPRGRDPHTENHGFRDAPDTKLQGPPPHGAGLRFHSCICNDKHGYRQPGNQLSLTGWSFQ